MVESVGDPSVGRFEVLEFIGDLFHGQSVTAASLIETARCRGARPAVIDTLRRLDRIEYRQFADLLADLVHLPAAVDPWEATP